MRRGDVKYRRPRYSRPQYQRLHWRANQWWLIGLWVLWLGIGVLGSGQPLQAQNRPVQATMVFVPPYTLSLADYSSATSNKLQLSLLLRDAASPLRRVKLRFIIEGSGLTIKTSQAFLNSNRPIPVNLVANLPTQLTGFNREFSQYFNPANLEVLGIDRNQFLRSKSLPSGIYRWRVEVLDYNLLVPLNNAQLSQQSLWMIRTKPPIVNSPQQNQVLRATNYGLQNVIFQWFNRSGSSPNSAFTTEYHVTLYEVYEANNARVADPRAAPRTLIYKNTLPLTNTTLIYNQTFPMLSPGKRYIFQVQARDREGRDLFENQGFSEAVVFQYGEECLPPTSIRAESPNTESIRLSWQGVPGSHTGYQIRYRLAGSNDEWTQTSSQFNDLTINRLQANTEYEYEVSSVCGQLDGTNYARGTAKTKAPNPQNFVCGAPQPSYDMANQEPLGLLNKGDVVKAGGYRVKIRRATGGNGQFSGVGIAEVPLGNTKVKLKMGFNNIFINSDYRMLRGQIYAARNKWKAMALATRLTVDAWRLTQDGKVEIQTNGNWRRLPTDGSQDYMLVDAKTGKKRFVDRNGRMDIPLEDRDYSNLNKEEIVAAAKKLMEEADEAIEDGRYGDALALTAKAEELLKSVGEKLKKVVGFAKLVLKVVVGIIREKQDTLGIDAGKLTKENKELAILASRLNRPKKELSNSQGNVGVNAYIKPDQRDGGVVSNEIKARIMQQKPALRAYESKLLMVQKKLEKYRASLLTFSLIGRFLNTNNIVPLVASIKKDLEATYKKYEALENKENTGQIEKELKDFIKQLIEKEKQVIVNKD